MSQEMPQQELITQIAQMFEQQTSALTEYIDGKIDGLDAKLSRRIDEMDDRLSSRIDELTGRIDGLTNDVRHVEQLLEVHSSDLYQLKALHPKMSHLKA
jgi:polyhydroxyalkanoate synthesis regulator phasin